MNDHQLEHEITLNEVTKSITKLNNNKTPRYDKITTEMIKYSPEELHRKITSIQNNCISNNLDINADFGLLAPLQKPGKTKGPLTNFRPVILDLSTCSPPDILECHGKFYKVNYKNFLDQHGQFFPLTPFTSVLLCVKFHWEGGSFNHFKYFENHKN